MTPGIPTNQRIYLLITPGSNGVAQLALSLSPPMIGEAVAAVLLRGMLPGGAVTLPFVSDPTKDPALTGPPGANATAAQVSTAVSAYLASNPPASGKDGVSPTISIGTVSTLPPGAAVTITNSGTSSALVLNIGIPAGATGAPGANATDAQVATAVAAYLAAHPPAAGPPGANATDAQVAAAVATWMAAHPISAVIGTVTFGETATLAIQAGVRQLNVACAGVAAGDAIVIAPTAALPAGYLLGRPIASAAGQLQISLTVPLIAIGAKYSITARVLRVG